MELSDFVRESNRIEGIYRDPTPAEIEAHERVLSMSRLTIPILMDFVSVVEPGASLRFELGMDVRVGRYVAPSGGPTIVAALDLVLAAANGASDPWVVHCAYEALHPFMDGNGRSGRAIWLWKMSQRDALHLALGFGFLHNFYYQTLDHQSMKGV